MAMRRVYSQRTITAVMTISAALGALGLSQSASADIRRPDEVYSSKVRYSDLNLSTEKGDQELLARIHRAARDVCTRSYGVWSPRMSLDAGFMHCVRDASNRAIAQLDNPMVTAAYTGHKSQETVQLAEAKTAP